MGKLIEGRFGIGVGIGKGLEEVFGVSIGADTQADEAYGQLIRFINERVKSKRVRTGLGEPIDIAQLRINRRKPDPDLSE